MIMKSVKQVALGVILVIISVGAITFGVISLRKGKAMPEWVKDSPIEKIDQTTFNVVEKPYREWKDLGEKDGKYKNPSTGKYTMTDIMTCAACGEKVPQPDFPKGTIPGEILDAYVCPKCGKRVMSGGGMPGVGGR